MLSLIRCSSHSSNDGNLSIDSNCQNQFGCHAHAPLRSLSMKNSNVFFRDLTIFNLHSRFEVLIPIYQSALFHLLLHQIFSFLFWWKIVYFCGSLTWWRNSDVGGDSYRTQRFVTLKVEMINSLIQLKCRLTRERDFCFPNEFQA